jgi:transmembrane sensor
MHQIERWYDAEVVYEGRVTDHFVADIPRDVPASKLLQLLELTNKVHFKIEGKKITVMP